MNDTTTTHGAAAETLMGDVAEEFIGQLNRGEHPDIEEYAVRYPQIASTIRQVFTALEFVRGAASDSDLTKGRSGTEASVTGTLGDYRIIREVGRGGMGVVYEAEQVSLGRRVALKVLPFAAVLDAKQLQRFKNEAQAAAQLHHTNIVPVHSVGCERGVHYYAMQFIEGSTLADVIHELSQVDSPAASQEDRPPSPGDLWRELISRLTPRPVAPRGT